MEEKHSWKVHHARIRKEATMAKNSAVSPKKKNAAAEKVNLELYVA